MSVLLTLSDSVSVSVHCVNFSVSVSGNVLSSISVLTWLNLKLNCNVVFSVNVLSVSVSGHVRSTDSQ